MMTLIREDEPFEMREERDESVADKVSARFGQNKVEIDPTAMKHLIDTLRDKLRS